MHPVRLEDPKTVAMFQAIRTALEVVVGKVADPDPVLTQLQSVATYYVAHDEMSDEEVKRHTTVRFNVEVLVVAGTPHERWNLANACISAVMAYRNPLTPMSRDLEQLAHWSNVSEDDVR